MTATSLRIEGLSFCYPGSPQVLDGLSLAVEPGERVAVLGPNGSGKTTLALHLNGLLELQTGTITVGDLVLEPRTLAEIRRRVGIVFQDPDDQLFMPTVGDDVGFGPANLGVARPERDELVAWALHAVGASELVDRTPHRLSGGEKRRAAIATVLAMHPGLLVLDEPTSGLDPFGRRELAELLEGLGHSLLVVTHDLPFAHAVCPRSVIIDRGRVVADGPTRELLENAELLTRHRLELPYGVELRTT